MSMNKTCPISNFTSEDCSDDMRFLLSQPRRLNESIPFDASFSSARDLVNVAPLQLGEELVDLHFDAVADLNCEAGTIFSASASKRGWPCRGASAGSIRIAAMLLPSRSR